MRVSLIVTVRNEAASIDGLLASVAAQMRPPDEIVLVDGGSTDDTVERVRRWQARGLPIRLAVRPGANIAQGRNAAAELAQGDLLAVTDAGVRLDPGWLAELVAPFARPDPPDVVCGFFRPDPQTLFEVALGATVLPAEEDVRPERFLPSSRSVALSRAAFERVGGYPEWLDYCEDLVFDLALKRAGCRFAWAPRAIAHFRPRPSLGAFFRQYYRYARGDGKADLWRWRHAVRYGVYLGGPLLLAASRFHPLVVALGLLGAAAYCRRPVERLVPWLRGRPLAEAALALALVPVIRLVGDVAKMLGYPVGVWWRLAGRRREVGAPAALRAPDRRGRDRPGGPGLVP